MKKQVKTYKHPKLRKAFIIVGIVLGSICGLFFLLWGGINTFKFAVYKEFYSITTKGPKIPGLNDNAVPQGITYHNDKYIMSMYMKNHSDPTRIYIMDKDGGNARYVQLYEDASFQKPCVLHCGGIQYVSAIDKLYVASAEKYIFELDTTTLFDNQTTKMQISNSVKVDNEASAIFSDDNYVYVSEFNKANSQWTTSPEHKLVCDNETHTAYISAFTIDKQHGIVDFTASPSLIYSIPDYIQGIAFKDNILYCSTSWGLSSSHLSLYDISKFKDVDGKKFVTNNSLTRSIKCPPMLEDLDFNSDGKLVTYNESASNKYFFGKLFFANKIYIMNVK